MGYELHRLDVTALPAHLRARVPEVDGTWEVVPDGGTLPEGTGGVLGSLPSGHPVYLADYTGEGEDGTPQYAGWIVVGRSRPYIPTIGDCVDGAPCTWVEHVLFDAAVARAEREAPDYADRHQVGQEAGSRAVREYRAEGTA